MQRRTQKRVRLPLAITVDKTVVAAVRARATKEDVAISHVIEDALRRDLGLPPVDAEVAA